MGPQRKEQETSIQQNSSQEAHPVSSPPMRKSKKCVFLNGIGH